MLLWTNWANPEDRPLWAKRDEWIEKFGEARADWMLRKSRNLCLYPNVYLMDQFSSQIRVVRPISVNKTEVDDLLHRAQGRAGRGARAPHSASTRTSSTPPAWPRPTTWRSSAPASTATRPAR